jgi:hypothetical protein
MSGFGDSGVDRGQNHNRTGTRMDGSDTFWDGLHSSHAKVAYSSSSSASTVRSIAPPAGTLIPIINALHLAELTDRPSAVMHTDPVLSI